MKRKNYTTKKNNFQFSNKFNKRENMNNINVTNNFADHEQRLLMDGVKNMLEAMIEEQHDIAERYSKLHPELEHLHQQYLTFDHVSLIKERINNPGYTPDPELEEEIQKVLDLY